MNVSFNGTDVVWVLIAGTFSVVMSLVWLYIAYRAMKAHERLAVAAELIARIPRHPSLPV